MYSHSSRFITRICMIDPKDRVAVSPKLCCRCPLFYDPCMGQRPVCPVHQIFRLNVSLCAVGTIYPMVRNTVNSALQFTLPSTALLRHLSLRHLLYTTKRFVHSEAGPLVVPNHRCAEAVDNITHSIIMVGSP